MMQSQNQLAGMLRQEVPGADATPSEIFADVINVIRADTKRLADALGVDIEIERMTEEQAAELLAGVTDGDGHRLILVFNEAAKQRDQILRELLTEEEYEEFMRSKTSALYTENPDTWE
jgi:hypothetical protein